MSSNNINTAIVVCGFVLIILIVVSVILGSVYYCCFHCSKPSEPRRRRTVESCNYAESSDEQHSSEPRRQRCAPNNVHMTSDMPVGLQNEINLFHPNINSDIANAERMQAIVNKEHRFSEPNPHQNSDVAAAATESFIQLRNDYDGIGRASNLPSWTQIPRGTFENENAPSPGLDISDEQFSKLQTVQELSENVPYEYANNHLNVAAESHLQQQQHQQNHNNSSSIGLAGSIPCIASSQVPCEQSIAWQPTYIGCQSTVIEPNEPYVLYKKPPEIWFRNLDDVMRERTMENAKEWDYYKFFDGRQKLAQFLNTGIVNRKDRYMRPVSTLEETYCFGKKQ